MLGKIIVEKVRKVGKVGCFLFLLDYQVITRYFNS